MTQTNKKKGNYIIAQATYEPPRLPNWCTERENCTAYVHVHWCPEDPAAKKYAALPWYKKLFRFNPRNF